MSLRTGDEERTTVLDRFTGLMNLLSRDCFLIPFSYAVIASGVGFGVYHFINYESPNRVENRDTGNNLDYVAYGLNKRQR